MKIRNQNFDFDVLNAADADRLQDAVDTLQAAAAAVPATAGLGNVIRANCAAIDSFLASILGEDYDIRMSINTNDLRALRALYLEVLSEIGKAKAELDISSAASPAAANPAAVTARVDMQALAQQAAQTAAQSLPAAATPPERAAVPFSSMNREQRRAWVRAIKGGKTGQ